MRRFTTTTHRSRWAAVGAAIALSLGGGGAFLAGAAGPSAPSSVVTIDPVRVLDTRDPLNVGLAGPFVSPVSQKLRVTGPIATTGGTATPVPAGATGVLLNVTAVGPTAKGFVSIRSGDATGAPATSSLNFDVNETAPNSVQVALPTAGANAGQIDITFDALGTAGPTTDLLIDVVGYLVAGAGGTGPAGPAGPAGAQGPQGTPGVNAPAAEFALASVFVDRGAGPTRYSTLSVPVGSPIGTTASGSFRFSCSVAQAPCSISYGAAVISDQAGNAFVHPRLLIHKESPGGGIPYTYCEYADGANNIAGLSPISRVASLQDAETAMDTALSMGVGGSLDCGSGQTDADGVVTEILVPSGGTDTAFYDVQMTFAFSPTLVPGLPLPPGE